MPDIADQEVASIRAKHDKHDMKGALEEVRADWEKHKANPADQGALAQKLISAGLMTDLALQYEKENLQATPSHTESRSHIRESAKIATGANDTLGATMLQNLDANWDRVAPKNSNILSESRINADLKKSVLATDAQSLMQPFRDDPSLFDKLKSDGRGSGLFVDDGNITKDSLTAAIQNPTSGLTDEQRAFAQKLRDQFDSPALVDLESGNWLTGHKLTQDSVNKFIADHPVPVAESALPSSTPPVVEATIPPGAPTPPRPDATIPPGAPTPARPDATIPPGAPTPPRPDATIPPGAPTPDGQARPSPTAEQIKEALTVRNGEGPYQSAARLRELYGLPEDPHKTLALAHEIAKKMNSPHSYNHGQVLDRPANPDPEVPAENAQRHIRAPRVIHPRASHQRTASA
jgi:hypothetical protein